MGGTKRKTRETILKEPNLGPGFQKQHWKKTLNQCFIYTAPVAIPIRTKFLSYNSATMSVNRAVNSSTWKSSAFIAWEHHFQAPNGTKWALVASKGSGDEDPWFKLYCMDKPDVNLIVEMYLAKRANNGFLSSSKQGFSVDNPYRFHVYPSDWAVPIFQPGTGSYLPFDNLPSLEDQEWVLNMTFIVSKDVSVSTAPSENQLSLVVADLLNPDIGEHISDVTLVLDLDKTVTQFAHRFWLVKMSQVLRPMLSSNHWGARKALYVPELTTRAELDLFVGTLYQDDGRNIESMIQTTKWESVARLYALADLWEIQPLRDKYETMLCAFLTAEQKPYMLLAFELFRKYNSPLLPSHSTPAYSTPADNKKIEPESLVVVSESNSSSSSSSSSSASASQTKTLTTTTSESFDTASSSHKLSYLGNLWKSIASEEPSLALCM